MFGGVSRFSFTSLSQTDWLRSGLSACLLGQSALLDDALKIEGKMIHLLWLPCTFLSRSRLSSADVDCVRYQSDSVLIFYLCVQLLTATSRTICHLSSRHDLRIVRYFRAYLTASSHVVTALASSSCPELLPCGYHGTTVRQNTCILCSHIVCDTDSHTWQRNAIDRRTTVDGMHGHRALRKV